MPPAVVERARDILARLEAGDREAPKARLLDDLPLFAAARPAALSPLPPRDEIGDALDLLQPDDMTPRQALEALFALKAKRAMTKKG
jgi:DNA mismatch repair protein MutS